MGFTSRTLIAAALLAFLPGLAAAQQSSGFYLGAGIGANSVEDDLYEIQGGGTDAKTDLGYYLGGFFGYAYGNGVRTDLELNYRNNDSSNPSNGEISSFGAFANAYYDFSTGTAFTPYLGLGLGAVRPDYEGTIGTLTLDDSDIVPAVQVIAGVSYAFNDNLSLFADYRHLMTDDINLKTTNGTQVSADYTNDTFMVGLRWLFAEPKPAMRPAAAPAPAAPPAAAPAPAPAPAPAMARNYLVFFDFDKSNLTNEAMNIVRMAANNAKTGNVTRIRLTGHADRSGGDNYNQRLSQRRGEAVKAELVRMGIPTNQIAVLARGESEPLVPTADGVREPQNRRVEIVFE
jgi:outer membrane protein OmpA-like peptidoglycan-associated protein